MTDTKSTDFETIVEEAIKNIRDDRDRALSCLNQLQIWIQAGGERMGDGASSMAKLLEVCQRSNEQFVKLAALKIKDRVENEDNTLTEEDREKMYEDISTA